MRSAAYRLLASITIGLGGLAALLFGISQIALRNEIVSKYSDYHRTAAWNSLGTNEALCISYGVGLILIAAISVAFIVLLNTKFARAPFRIGPMLFVMPLWLIEVTSLLAYDYSLLFRDNTWVLAFVLSMVVVALGGIGIVLLPGHRAAPGRVFAMIFLVVLSVGSIADLLFIVNPSIAASSFAFSLLGNIARLIAIPLVVYALFVRERRTLQTEPEARPDGTAPMPLAETNKATKPIPSNGDAETEKTKNLRQRLLEAKSLYEEGLIDQDEYSQMKKQALEERNSQ